MKHTNRFINETLENIDFLIFELKEIKEKLNDNSTLIEISFINENIYLPLLEKCSIFAEIKKTENESPT